MGTIKKNSNRPQKYTNTWCLLEQKSETKVSKWFKAVKHLLKEVGWATVNSTPTHVFESSAHEMSPFTVNLHEPDWSITLKPQYGRRHTCLLYTGKAITTAFVCNNVAILLDASLNIDIFPWLKEKVALTDCLHLKPLPSKKKKKEVPHAANFKS